MIVKRGMFTNFRTIIYELPDKASRIIESTITNISCSFYIHENMYPDWVYVETNLINGSGYVGRDKIEETGVMDFQKVTAFKNICIPW